MVTIGFPNGRPMQHLGPQWRVMVLQGTYSEPAECSDRHVFGPSIQHSLYRQRMGPLYREMGTGRSQWKYRRWDVWSRWNQFNPVKSTEKYDV